MRLIHSPSLKRIQLNMGKKQKDKVGDKTSVLDSFYTTHVQNLSTKDA